MTPPQPMTTRVPKAPNSLHLYLTFIVTIFRFMKISNLLMQCAYDTGNVTKAHCSSVIHKFIPILLYWYHKWGFNLNKTKSEASHNGIVGFSPHSQYPFWYVYDVRTWLFEDRSCIFPSIPIFTPYFWRNFCIFSVLRVVNWFFSTPEL